MATTTANNNLSSKYIIGKAIKYSFIAAGAAFTTFLADVTYSDVKQRFEIDGISAKTSWQPGDHTAAIKGKTPIFGANRDYEIVFRDWKNTYGEECRKIYYQSPEFVKSGTPVEESYKHRDPNCWPHGWRQSFKQQQVKEAAKPGAGS